MNIGKYKIVFLAVNNPACIFWNNYGDNFKWPVKIDCCTMPCDYCIFSKHNIKQLIKKVRNI